MKVIRKRGVHYTVKKLDKHTHHESIAAEVRRKRVQAAMRTVEPDGLIVAIKEIEKIQGEI
jgi:hypothetical protein